MHSSVPSARGKYIPTRPDLIEIHRRRYFLSAQAALRGEKEIRPPSDCGFHWQPVEIKFIEGIESKLPHTHSPLEWRAILCQRLTAEEPVPELDARLDSYVTALRGADQPLPPTTFEASRTDPHVIITDLTSEL